MACFIASKSLLSRCISISARPITINKIKIVRFAPINQLQLKFSKHCHQSCSTFFLTQNQTLSGIITPSSLLISRTFSHTNIYSNKAGSITDDILKSKKGENQQASAKTTAENSSLEKKAPSKKKSDSWLSAKNGWKIGLICIVLSGAILFGEAMYFWGRPIIDENGHDIQDEYSHMPWMKAYFLRTLKEIKIFKKAIEEPSLPKLLPDPLKEPYYQPKYTLILELTDVLVHPDWTLNTGWRFKKRPYLDIFLRAVGPPTFEIVIYTKESGMTAFPLVDKIDTVGAVSYRLFRDATRYTDGEHVKDLSCINRDLSKVIVVDVNNKSVKFHPENGFILKKWDGSDEDTTLWDLANFLTTVAKSNVDDVRTVLEYYSQYDDPLEAFKENQRKLQEQQQETSQVQYKGLASSIFRGFSRR